MAKYRCRGCNHEADARWRGPCPKCRGFWEAKKVGTDGNGTKKGFVTAADSLSDDAAIKYVKTGIDNFDSVLNGGLVEGQLILFGAPLGTGKTRFALQLSQSLVGRQDKSIVFASAEEPCREVIAACKQVGAESDRIRILGDDNGFDIIDVLRMCEEVDPYLLVLDSLQAVDGWSTQNTETILMIKERCDKTGMRALVMNHMGKDLDFRGLTTVGHAVKTTLSFYRFDPQQDGRTRDLFGKKFVDDIEDGIISLNDMRTMMSGKSRSGGSDRKEFFIFNKQGRLEQLTKLPPKKRIHLAGFDEDEI